MQHKDTAHWRRIGTLAKFQIDNAPYWTRMRDELLEWFNARAPSFAEGYTGAVHLLHNEFPARVQFICHVVRDIYRNLPAALGMQAISRRSEFYPDMVKNLSITWNQSMPLISENLGFGYLVSESVYKKIIEIIKKENEMKTQPKVGEQLAIALFRASDRREEFMHPAVIDAFNDEYAYFMSKAHFPAKLEKGLADEGLKEHFEAFERAFHSLIGPYFSGKEEIDAILQDTNATTD